MAPYIKVDVYCWYDVPRETDQATAASICEGEGGSLVTIDSEEKRDALAAYLQGL